MAINWSAWKNVGAPVNFRTGIEITYSPTTITASTATVTVTTKLYLGASGSAEAFGGSYTVTGSDSASATQVAWDLNPGGGTALLATLTETVTLTFSSQSFTINATIRPSGSWPGSVSHTHKVTIPAKPMDPPNAPTGFTATRVHDGRIDLAWTNNPTSAKPYNKGLELVRIDQVSGSYVTVANLSDGTRTSFTDTTTQQDRNYRYGIRAKNTGGNSGWSYVDVNTTPGAMMVSSVRKDDAGNVIVTRGALPSSVRGEGIVGSAGSWDIEHSADGGPATLAFAGRGVDRSTYVHPTPSTTSTHRYRVRAVSGAPNSLPGPWSAWSQTIQLLAAPNAPTGLGPTVADADVEFQLEWDHNPVDTTPQSAYEVRHREVTNPASAWTSTGTVSTPVETHAVLAATWVNGTQREWQVRTWGAHADPSPWSASQVTTLSTAPVAGITAPGPTHDSSRVTIAWSYHDAEASPQSRWEVALTVPSQFGPGAESGPYAYTVVDSRSGFGSAASADLTARVDDGASYVAWARVADGTGMWSAWVSQEFTVAYAVPPQPTVEATWHPQEGYVTLAVDAPASGEGEVPLESIAVYRASEQGWVLVDEQLQPGQSVNDMIPPMGTTVTYMAVAVSALPSERTSVHAVVETPTKWVFLNYGPGWGNVVRVWGNLSASRSFSRNRALHHFAGRPDPVEFRGASRTRTYELTAWLPAPWLAPDPSSTFAEIEALAQALAPVCLRDPEGVRMFTSVGDVSLPGHLTPRRSVSIPLTQVDWSEPVQ